MLTGGEILIAVLLVGLLAAIIVTSNRDNSSQAENRRLLSQILE